MRYSICYLSFSSSLPFFCFWPLFICSQHVCLHPFLLLFISLSFITFSIFYFSLHTPSQVPNNNPKTLIVKQKWESLGQREARDRFFPSKTSVLPLNSLTLHTRPTHSHTQPPGGLIQAFISPNRGTDNHSTPMRSPRYHPCECVWMHLCVCLPLEPQSATQRTQEKTWHLLKTEHRASKWASDSWTSLQSEAIEQRHGLFTERRILGVLHHRDNMKTLSVLCDAWI